MKQNKPLGVLSVTFMLGVFIRFLMVPALAQPATLVNAGASESTDPFSELSISARGAYVFDAKTGEALFASNEDMQLPLASLAKVMTAIIAVDTLDPDAVITVSDRNAAETGSVGLRGGESWTLKNLSSLTLVGSLNGGAQALSEAAGAQMLRAEGHGVSTGAAVERFVKEMNARARELGLTKTYFLNVSGLDESGVTSGAYSSARDAAMLFAYAAMRYPDVFLVTAHESVSAPSKTGRVMVAVNTNESVASIPGVLLSKTGTTPLAGGNLGIVFDAALDHPVVAILLGDTPEARFADMTALVTRTQDLFASRR